MLTMALDDLAGLEQRFCLQFTSPEEVAEMLGQSYSAIRSSNMMLWRFILINHN